MFLGAANCVPSRARTPQGDPKVPSPPVPAGRPPVARRSLTTLPEPKPASPTAPAGPAPVAGPAPWATQLAWGTWGGGQQALRGGPGKSLQLLEMFCWTQTLGPGWWLEVSARAKGRLAVSVLEKLGNINFYDK